MQCLRSLLAVSCLCVSLMAARGSELSLCTDACNTPPEKVTEGTMLVKHMCGCVGDATFDPFDFLDMASSTTAPPSGSFRAKHTTTTTPQPTVTSICDYLCAHQMGGEACMCSNPSLPGK